MTSEIYKTIKDLHLALKEAGIINYKNVNNFRQFWLYPREKSGKLNCPRGYADKRYRLFTDKQIADIIEAFKPGGPQEYNYENVH